MSEEKSLISIAEIKQAFAASVESEKKTMEENKTDLALGYLAKAIHDMQEAGIDVELLDMRSNTSISNDNGNSLYTASFRLSNQTVPLTIYSKQHSEGKGRYLGHGLYADYDRYQTISIHIDGVTNRTFNYKETPETVYAGLVQDLIRAAARQEILHKMDDKGVFNVPSALRSEETTRKVSMPVRPALGGDKKA
jgi:hypothetical protein